MGIMEDTKETLHTAGEKVRHEFEETKDRLGDKVDEMKAEGEAKKAETERDHIKQRNDMKEKMRD